MTDKLRNSDNPLLQEWTTRFAIPPFNHIETEHFKTAFDISLNAHHIEIKDIADNPETPDFNNIIKAMELSGEPLRKVASTFYNLSGSHTNEALQAIERDIAPKMAAHSNSILLNEQLFTRVDTLFKSTSSLALTPEQTRVLERTHSRFVRAGANLEGTNRKRVAAIAEELATLGTRFAQNMLADEKSFELILEKQDLDGLPDFLIAAALQAGSDRGHENKYVITLSRSSIEPFLQFSSRRDLREKSFKGWIARGENGGEHDNRQLVAQTLKLREERARLLGFENFAAFKIDDQMARTPEAVRELLMAAWVPAREKALKEAEKLQELASSEGNNQKIAAWDWRYYSEKVRRAEFDIDEAETKPYFQLDKMIEAAFDVAGRLFGLTFSEIHDIPLYHEDARIFEVKNADDEHVGLFLGDYFARGSKRSGAWMSAFRSQHKLDGEIHPIIVNVMNFSKAGKGEASLLTFDDARTLFHEFGHALHGLLSDVTYPSISGTSVARDFVELPSQLYEHWLSTPEILAKYARHYKTGEAIPKALLDRLLAAQNFNQGFQTVEYVSTALIDLEAHVLKDAGEFEASQFEKNLLGEIGMPDAIVMRHRIPHLAHAFAGDGYSAGYYSYMWSEVMDADAFVAFEETGDVFNIDLAAKLKRFIYSAGGRQDPADAYKAFRGRMPTMDALLKKRGLA
ncbi:MAG: M3 family metallopeptidase [Cohaesibacteraceae bacterium]|nr:M3 family metallopeptidase [Cohaesibacteraceae bacterium]